MMTGKKAPVNMHSNRDYIPDNSQLGLHKG